MRGHKPWQVSILCSTCAQLISLYLLKPKYVVVLQAHHENSTSSPLEAQKAQCGLLYLLKLARMAIECQDDTRCS